jgi:hypothetical protein
LYGIINDENEALITAENNLAEMREKNASEEDIKAQEEKIRSIKKELVERDEARKELEADMGIEPDTDEDLRMNLIRLEVKKLEDLEEKARKEELKVKQEKEIEEKREKLEKIQEDNANRILALEEAINKKDVEIKALDDRVEGLNKEIAAIESLSDEDPDKAKRLAEAKVERDRKIADREKIKKDKEGDEKKLKKKDDDMASEKSELEQLINKKDGEIKVFDDKLKKLDGEIVAIESLSDEDPEKEKRLIEARREREEMVAGRERAKEEREEAKIELDFGTEKELRSLVESLEISRDKLEGEINLAAKKDVEIDGEISKLRDIITKTSVESEFEIRSMNEEDNKFLMEEIEKLQKEVESDVYEIKEIAAGTVGTIDADNSIVAKDDATDDLVVFTRDIGKIFSEMAEGTADNTTIMSVDNISVLVADNVNILIHDNISIAEVDSTTVLGKREVGVTSDGARSILEKFKEQERDRKVNKKRK